MGSPKRSPAAEDLFGMTIFLFKEITGPIHGNHPIRVPTAGLHQITLLPHASCPPFGSIIATRLHSRRAIHSRCMKFLCFPWRYPLFAILYQPVVRAKALLCKKKTSVIHVDAYSVGVGVCDGHGITLGTGDHAAVKQNKCDENNRKQVHLLHENLL